jgi:hypothetical protein
MTQPSVVLDAIATNLRTLLGPAALDVRVVDSSLTIEHPDVVAAKSTAVLVACPSFKVAAEYEPPTATCRFAAVLVVKLPKGSSQASRGDVAMDLAALVGSHVGRENWGVCASQAEDVRVRNLNSPDMNIVLWGVEWTQKIQLDAKLNPELLNRLGSIHITYAMGGPDTPEHSSIQEFPS